MAIATATIVSGVFVSQSRAICTRSEVSKASNQLFYREREKENEKRQEGEKEKERLYGCY